MSNIDPKCLCPGCMAVLDEPDLPCPLCGFEKDTYTPSQRSLRPKTILNGKYLVGKVIGEGGFGITYIGFNLDTELPVAIKEYFPAELATRDAQQGNSITIFSGEAQTLYREGLEKYLREARNLTMFSELPGIVTVKDFFYENETAYIIMEYINGVTMKQYLTKVGGRMNHAEVVKLMKPVLESMNRIHEVGIIHRDISPDNIMITKTNQVKLTDFGAARVFDTEDNKSITVVLKRGYAPEEQYRAKGNQGPWTDVYALCATIYKMITGVTPQEALERMIDDNVEPISKFDPSVWPETEYAIMKGMSLKAEDRYQTVNELVDALYYSVLETDENGEKYLVCTREQPTEEETPAPAPAAVDEKVDEGEFEIKPIVVSVGKNSGTPVAPVVPKAEAPKLEVKQEAKEEVKKEEPKEEPAKAEAAEVAEVAPVAEKEAAPAPAPAQPKAAKKGGFFKSTFKKLVKLQLGKVRFEDTITDLNVEHMDIGNINVLKDCHQIKKLVLNNNMLDDLSPISECYPLEYLAVKNTLVGDLSPIKNLTNLKYLDLWGTRITDLHDIYGLKNLTYLCLKNTEIRQSQIDDFKKHVPDCVVES